MTEVITVHPAGDMNVGTRFRGVPYNSWRDILVKNTNVNLREKSGDRQRH